MREGRRSDVKKAYVTLKGQFLTSLAAQITVVKMAIVKCNDFLVVVHVIKVGN